MDDSETMNEDCMSYTLYGKTVDECPDGTNTNEDECSCHCSPTCEPGKTSVPTGDHRDGYYSIGMRNSFNSGAYLYIGNITAKNLSTGIPAGWVYSIKLTSTNHPDDLQLLRDGSDVYKHNIAESSFLTDIDGRNQYYANQAIWQGCTCACPDADLATKCATGGDAESITHWNEETCTCECMLGSPGATDKCPPNMKNGYDGENPDTCKCVCDEEALGCTADQTAVQGEDGCECGCDGKRMSVADAECTSSHENKYFIQDTCSCDCISIEHSSNYACNNGMMELDDECNCVCKELECTGNRVTTLTENGQCLCQCADQEEEEKWTSLDAGHWDADSCEGECMNSGTVCPSPQTFNEETCQCECDDVACGDVKKMVTDIDYPGQCYCECPQSNWEIYNCNKKDSSRWNDSTCECECFANAYSGQIDCGPGSTWNPSACDCSPISTLVLDGAKIVEAGSTTMSFTSESIPDGAIEGATAILSPYTNISENRTVVSVTSGSDNPAGEIQDGDSQDLVQVEINEPATFDTSSVLFQSADQVYHTYKLCDNQSEDECGPHIIMIKASADELLPDFYPRNEGCCFENRDEQNQTNENDWEEYVYDDVKDSMTNNGVECCGDPHICTFFGEKYDM